MFDALWNMGGQPRALTSTETATESVANAGLMLGSTDG